MKSLRSKLLQNTAFGKEAERGRAKGGEGNLSKKFPIWHFLRILRRVGEHFVRYVLIFDDFTSCGRALFATFEGFTSCGRALFATFREVFGQKEKKTFKSMGVFGLEESLKNQGEFQPGPDIDKTQLRSAFN